MRVLIYLALMVLSPVLALADVQWHEFVASRGDKKTITIGRVSVIVETREVEGGAFKEDNLVITVRAPDEKEGQHWFTSSYGMGAVAVHRNLLLLKYGVGLL